MHKRFWSNLFKSQLLICASSVAFAALAESNPAATLLAKYTSITEQLRQNQFKRPLVLESVESQNRLKGDIYAVVDYPFDAVSSGLSNPDHWCDIMILHLNTKYCHAQTGSTGTTLIVNIGKKTPEELVDTSRVDFNYGVVSDTSGYVEIKLDAKKGPMGTSDYRILLEAVPLAGSKKTFLHLTYSYSVGFTGRLAMQTYLGTVGSGKVGFTVIGQLANGQPVYIDGVRGLMERNTMRYYLAIDSFLGAASAAPAAQPEKRFQSWFTASERYPRQLHELNRGEYLDMKRNEYLRQQSAY